MTDQNVIACRRITVQRNGKETNTNTYILTFGQPTIPASVKIGYQVVKVDQFFPSPLRCFNCQNFGHHKATCKRAAICTNCGQPEHGATKESPCTAPAHCANCGEEHAAHSRDCHKWVQEKEIVKIKHTMNITFPEARKKYQAIHAMMLQSRPSYAAVAKSTSTVEVQTDLTWPITADTYSKLPSGTATHEITARKRTASDNQPPTRSNVEQAAQTASTPQLNKVNLGARPKEPAPNQPKVNKPSQQPRQPEKKGTVNRVNTGRIIKGSNDPIQLYNRFGQLGPESEMVVLGPSKAGNNRGGGKTPHR